MVEDFGLLFLRIISDNDSPIFLWISKPVSYNPVKNSDPGSGWSIQNSVISRDHMYAILQTQRLANWSSTLSGNSLGVMYASVPLVTAFVRVQLILSVST